MADYSVDEFNREKTRMASDFDAAIAVSKDLLKSAAAVSSDVLAVARAKFEEKSRSAGAILAGVSESGVEKAMETAAAADHYVHRSPWTAIGIAAAAGMVAGFLVARR